MSGLGFLHGIETIEVDDGTRPIETVRSSVIGVVGTAPDADAAKFPENEPVLLLGQPRAAKDLGDAGTLKSAVDGVFDQIGAAVVLIRVPEGVDQAATLSNVIGDSTAMTGVHALKGAKSEVKVTPRILVAPGFTSVKPEDPPGTYLANPVVAEMLGIADSLRATIVADGPNTNMTDAVSYAQDWGSARVYPVDPHVKVWDTTLNAPVVQPASARVAGAIARRDNKKGFWWSPSNQEIYGIMGGARPIEFAINDRNTEANFLNENNMATIIQEDGYRLWGNRTCSSDPMWAFLSVRRTADMIYESVEQALLWAMDRPMSANLVLDIQESVNAYLRHLKKLGAILGGTVWLDQELNTPENLMAGQLWLDYDIEPPAPLEHLVFRAHRNNGYYKEMVADVARAA